MSNNVEYLLKYLQKHSADVVSASEDGIFVVSHWTRRRSDGTIESGSNIERVAANKQAVREWLGY